MTTPALAPDMNVPPQPSPFQRVINTFIAPTKAFVGLDRGKNGWWLPFLRRTPYSPVTSTDPTLMEYGSAA